MRITGIIMVTAIIAAAALFAAGKEETPEQNVKPTQVRSTTVAVAPARRVTFERTLTVQGNVQAKNLAMISPRVAGTLEEIMVDEGDAVAAGVTPLFQTDSVKLAKTFEIRRHEVNVAEFSLREKQASCEKNQADLEKAAYDWKRQQDMFEREISSQDEYEEAHAEHKRCSALLKHAQALADLAEAQLQQTRSALSIAEKDLRDSLVVAPIDGRVTMRYQEPGEMGETGNAVLRIEDPTLLEVSVYLPARAYGEVIPQETKMRVTANGVDVGEHVVSYKSPTIDKSRRTFEARCLLREPPRAVAAGAMAQVSVILERRDGLGVPRDAIQRRIDGAIVFVAENGRARLATVKTGLEKDDLIEIDAEGISDGASIVTMGGYFLNNDEPITVQ